MLRHDILSIAERSFSRGTGYTASGPLPTSPPNPDRVLDIDSSTKGARFVRFCDAFNILLWIVS